MFKNNITINDVKNVNMDEIDLQNNKKVFIYFKLEIFEKYSYTVPFSTKKFKTVQESFEQSVF